VNLNDTIAAISSAAGPAARMIVRASGSGACEILAQITSPNYSSPARKTTLRLAGMTVPAWIYQFKAPRTYTGDDLFELHLPGNPLLARMVLDCLVELGARQADPGEFTARAYFNGRLDLAQAEGVAAIISAGSRAELTAAAELAGGELSRRLRTPMDRLIETLAQVEAEIDFSDQDVPLVAGDELSKTIEQIDASLDSLLNQSAQFEKLNHEPTVVLAGRPNAGKSTLLNALAQADRAVVSPIAGTTRDALSASIALSSGIIRLVDVAGLDDRSPNSEIESHMRRRAEEEILAADSVVLVCDSTEANPPMALPRPADLIVWSKIDLAGPRRNPIEISALTGQGMDELRAALDALAFAQPEAGEVGKLALNARHIRAITAGRDALARALQQVKSQKIELVAAELRTALDELGLVLGVVSPDDLLGKIFSSFCIGK
jgi:tRNA modification GTPase